MSRHRIHLQSWQVGHSPTEAAKPARWVPAAVPGAVQLDWARAEAWPPYWQGDNFKAYGWMEDVFWHYQVLLPEGTPAPGHRRWLVLRGIDYRFEVRIGGRVLHTQEGMFSPIELDVSEHGGAPLDIVVWPVPKYPGAHRPKAQAARSCKPSVSYGWDWHPRLIPLGIWDEAFCEDRPALALSALRVQYTLSAALDAVAVDAHVHTDAMPDGHTLLFRLTCPEGREVATQQASAAGVHTVLSTTLETPRLWWPNGQGEAALYTSTVALVDRTGAIVDTLTRRHGFRRVELLMNEGAWDEPGTFPKSRSVPPITLTINGRPVFAKGSNWVNPEIFPGIITAETYRPLLESARDAHFNILRCWGGAIVNKESFFDICDELGLMVWQEFPLACNDYADDPAYLAVLDRESRAIIERCAQHPSLALWCGGNELFNVWSGMTDQRKALRLLNRNCYDLDPDTPFLPTSPVMGMGHGDYRFRDENGREAFQMFTDAGCTAYTEFGCPGPSDVEYLATFIPPDELASPRPGTSWETHHAFAAWAVAPESWLFPSLIEHYFGKPADLAELVHWGQLMQAEGYRALFEEARRQKPRASMALNWCYNEPWPSAANNSLINWPHRRKPAFDAVAEACRPVLASARLPRFSWQQGDFLEAELFLLNDQPHAVAPGRLRCLLDIDGQTQELLTWDFPELPANQNLAGPIARAPLPAASGKTFVVRLQVDGRPALDSRYTLCFRPGRQRTPTRVGFINNA